MSDWITSEDWMKRLAEIFSGCDCPDRKWVLEQIRRHAPPQPGKEPQAVQEANTNPVVMKEPDETCPAAPQPSPSPVDVEKIEQHLTDFHNGRISGALVAGDVAALLAEVRDLRRSLGVHQAAMALGSDAITKRLAAAQAREKRLREACEAIVENFTGIAEQYRPQCVKELKAALQQQPSDGNPPTP